MNLSVLIACKDRPNNIQYCLGSIDAAYPRPAQTVLVDFGSAKPLRRYGKKYPWLRVVRVDRDTKVFHKARALNIGLKHVTHPYVCSTDADQIFQPNFFKVVKNTLMRGQKQFVMCRTYLWKSDIPSWLSSNDMHSGYLRLKANLPKGARLKGEGCCMAVKTAWAMRVHGWDEKYIGYGAEDSDFMFRALFCGFRRVWVQNLTSMIHLPHPKKTEYYSWDKYIARNRKRFYKRKVKRDTVVNPTGQWGML